MVRALAVTGNLYWLSTLPMAPELLKTVGEERSSLFTSYNVWELSKESSLRNQVFQFCESTTLNKNVSIIPQHGILRKSQETELAHLLVLLLLVSGKFLLWLCSFNRR